MWIYQANKPMPATFYSDTSMIERLGKPLTMLRKPYQNLSGNDESILMNSKYITLRIADIFTESSDFQGSTGLI